ncbi:hypothetical protein O181_004068 [Austropuccinia psidii MF-1]|uniref:Integrase catalytic domain-containing protein n=1 Tax=Austropuccinia psidii MF-1 TaxID=1389203 RepID=A0A9Q3BFV7_9BASI|nr:hypothetical protein [Austropuccinia psidii MF-1]
MFPDHQTILSRSLADCAFIVDAWVTGERTAHKPKPRTTIPRSSACNPLCNSQMLTTTSCKPPLPARVRVKSQALRTDNTQEFTLATFSKSLAKLGLCFVPSLPYSPQENGEAKSLNRTLGDMARAMLTCFWQLAYTSTCFIHNWIPNSWSAKSSPYQELYGQPPSIATLYPFGADTLVHILAVHQHHKLDAREIESSFIFPQFQPSNKTLESPNKGSLRHIVNTMSLGEVPTEQYFESGNWAINLIILAKDVSIPDHLGKALSGAYQEECRAACWTELDQMATRDVWEVLPKLPGIKTIGNQWVFDLKHNLDGTMEKFKARLVARGGKQRPGIDCAKMYVPMASLMSLRLLLGTAVLKCCQKASFDVLRLKKALYGICQAGRCWWKFLSGILEHLGFVATEVDQSLYIFHNRVLVIAIWIHVDDGVIMSNTPRAISDFRSTLCAELHIKWSDKMAQIVGLECVIGKGEVVMMQQHLTEGILEAYPQQLI